MIRFAAAACVFGLAHVASAQSGPAPSPIATVDVLIGVTNVLHIADMVTTSYALAKTPAAQEGNPVLKPFARTPVGLSVVSGAAAATNILIISKLRARRPRTAALLSVALVVTKTIAVTSNIRTIGNIQAARSGWRHPLRP